MLDLRSRSDTSMTAVSYALLYTNPKRSFSPAAGPVSASAGPSPRSSNCAYPPPSAADDIRVRLESHNPKKN